jgi:hypothetical protein
MVFIQVVIDHLGQDVRTSPPITECMMDFEGPKMQRTIWSVGLLNLFRSLSRMVSLLILDMGLFFPSDGCAWNSYSV